MSSRAEIRKSDNKCYTLYEYIYMYNKICIYARHMTFENIREHIIEVIKDDEMNCF